jgi:hypothetical protein
VTNRSAEPARSKIGALGSGRRGGCQSARLRACGWRIHGPRGGCRSAPRRPVVAPGRRGAIRSMRSAARRRRPGDGGGGIRSLHDARVTRARRRRPLRHRDRRRSSPWKWVHEDDARRAAQRDRLSRRRRAQARQGPVGPRSRLSTSSEPAPPWALGIGEDGVV